MTALFGLEIVTVLKLKVTITLCGWLTGFCSVVVIVVVLCRS